MAYLLKNVQSPLGFPLAGKSIDIVHPCNDYWFNTALHNQQVACGFLNAILGISGTDEISHVRYLDKELPNHVFWTQFYG